MPHIPQPRFSIDINDGDLTLSHNDGLTIGLTIRRTGNKSAQEATVTISNHFGTLFPDKFPSRAEIRVKLDNTLVFTGFIDHAKASTGNPGQIILECVGRTGLLRDMPVRPIVYNSRENETRRDGSGVLVRAHDGRIELPTDKMHIPIFEVDGIRDSDDEVVIVQSIEEDEGIIHVDRKHDGEDLTVNYTVFRAEYDGERADTIVKNLVRRHSSGRIDVSGVASIATTLNFEPNKDSNLLRELGRIRDTLGGQYDFFVDDGDVLHFFERSGDSVLLIEDTEVHQAEFSEDYSAYANVVTARSSTVDREVQTDKTEQLEGTQEHQVEGLNPSGFQVDAVAQGFKAEAQHLEEFQVKGRRNTESDVLDWEVQYNGQRRSVDHADFDDLESLAPDADNVIINDSPVSGPGSETASSTVEVSTDGSGNAYFSSDWLPDLSQTTSDSNDSSDGTWQSVSVADLTRTLITGFVFKGSSSTGQVRFNVYSGEGVGGEQIAESRLIDLSTDGAKSKSGWTPVYFDGGIDVSGETTITFEKSNESGTPDWSYQAATGPYDGGRASTGTNDDFAFQVITSGDPKAAFASLIFWTEQNFDTDKAPTMYVARDYVIGMGSRATWKQMLNNIPALFMDDAGETTSFGVKMEFSNLSTAESGSTAADPRLVDLFGSVAYLDSSEDLDSPSGIVAGGLSGSARADALPTFDRELGSFTEPIPMDPDTHVEPGGNYWLVLADGTASSLTHWFLRYDDGADDSVHEVWADEDNIAISASVVVEDDELKLQPFSTTGFFRTGDLLTADATITHATLTEVKSEKGGVVMPLLSRNQRNFYLPGRSTDPDDPPVNTGEICIIQFDDGDQLRRRTGSKTAWKDVSGNGFDAGQSGGSIGARWDIVDGVFGQAYDPNGTHGGGSFKNRGRLTIEGVHKFLTGDLTLAFHARAQTLSDGNTVLAWGNVPGATETPRTSLWLGINTDGTLTYTHSYGHGEGVEEYTTTTTMFVQDSWEHLALRRDLQNRKVTFYLNGEEKESFSFTEMPDIFTVSDISFFQGSQDIRSADVWVDDIRFWPFVAPSWAIDHVRQYPYHEKQVKFEFPTESDSNDTFTDSPSASGDTNLRVYGALFAAPFYEDRIRMRVGFDSLAGNTGDHFWGDLSSYANIRLDEGEEPTVDTTNVGRSHGSSAAFNGTDQYLRYAHSDGITTRGGFTLMGYLKQDVEDTFQTPWAKEDSYWVQIAATSSTQSTIIVDVYHATGTRRLTADIPLGTQMKHVAVTYDLENIRVFVDGSQEAIEEFDSKMRSSDSRKSLFLGVRDVDGTKSSFWDGSMDEFILLSYAADSSDIETLKDNRSAGLRSPTQFSYRASAFSGSGSKAYSDGKYLVSRDDEQTWVDTLNGTDSNPNGTLAFKLIYGTRERDLSISATRKDLDEIDRIGYEVEKILDVNTDRLDVLESVAEGTLTLLKDGLRKGTVTMPLSPSVAVGDIVTVDYPTKGQSEREFAVASVQHTVSEGHGRTRLQLGEAELSLTAFIKGTEVGFGG